MLNILRRQFCPPLLSYFIMFSAFTVVLYCFPFLIYLSSLNPKSVDPGELSQSDVFALNFYIRCGLQSEMHICFLFGVSMLGCVS